MNISRSSSERTSAHYQLEPETPQLRAMLDAVLSGPPPAKLAALAERRTGFGNSDGGFGVIYPGDLDDFDRVHTPINDNCVQVYCFFGAPTGYEYDLPETLYLEFLAAFLRSHALNVDAGRMDTLRASLGG